MITKNEMLKAYIDSNVAPILVAGIKASEIGGAVVLPASLSQIELCSRWEGAEELPPKWYDQVISKQAAKNFLVIDGIDKIPVAEQKKFGEILEHRKVWCYDLPKTTVIVVLADKINSKTINEDIYRLVAHIEG